MASFKITDLTELAAVDVADADLLEIVDFDTDSSKKVSIQSLKTVFTATPAGSDTQIQFNDGGSFGADAGLTFDSSTNTLSVGESGNGGVIRLNRPSGGSEMGNFSAQNSGAWLGVAYNLGKSHIWFDNATKSVTIGNGVTSLGASLGVVNTVDQVGYRLDLSNGQTSDAFQINSYGNTGGDLFRITSDGETTITGDNIAVNIKPRSAGGPAYTGLGYFIKNQGGTSIASFESRGGSGEMRLWSGVSYFLSFYSNNQEAMRIDTSGNVGIGTSSPSTTLHAVGGVTGAIGETYTAKFQATYPSIILEDDGGNSGYNKIAFSLIGNNLYIPISNSSDTWQRYAGGIQMNTGNWSIGSYNAVARLHIKGNSIGSIGLRVDLSNGQTSDALQINSYGNTGGDLFKVTTNGGMVLNTSGTIVSGWSEGFNIGGSASATFRLSDTSTNKGFGMFFQNGFNYIARTTDNWSTLSYIGAFRDDRFGLGTLNPNSSSIFEMSSTTKGFLPPRMTTTQRDAISSPATGLLIFNTTTVKLEYYSGTAWGQV